MQIRNLGRSGLRVSLVGLGCNNFGGRIDLVASRRVVHKALALGITLFDTADTYGTFGGSETCLGEILGARRNDIVLATKFGMPMNAEGTIKGASRRYIMSEVEASLKRLKTDWIDLYQLHQPDPLRRSRRPCARSTTSCARARCATSAAPTCRPGRWWRRSGRRGTTGSRPSSARRTNTAWWCATSIAS